MSSESYEEIKNSVEAILFSYGDWISVRDIQNTLGVDSELMIKNALDEVSKKFSSGYSFKVEEEDGKWRMALWEDYSDLVSGVITGTEIPKQALKVLGVIAYEQPVTKTRLSEILGKSVKQEISYLYRNKFLSYQKYGNGKYYKVTKKFYDYFKLEEDEDFRGQVNKSINVFLDESLTDESEEDNGEIEEEKQDIENRSEENK